MKEAEKEKELKWVGGRRLGYITVQKS